MLAASSLGEQLTETIASRQPAPSRYLCAPLRNNHFLPSHHSAPAIYQQTIDWTRNVFSPQS